MTDEQLMQAYQRGDESAFETLYRRYAPRVYGYLKKHIGESSRRDEVFQNIFLKLHKSRRLYDPNLPFVPWLFTICRSVVIDSVRGGKVFESSATPQEIETAANRVWESPREKTELPLEALHGLSEPQRKVIEMRYLDEMSYRAMGKRLDLTEASVRKRVSRAVKDLRAKIRAKE